MSTDGFIAEEVQVEQSPGSPQPLRFVWLEQTHEIAEARLLECVEGASIFRPKRVIGSIDALQEARTPTEASDGLTLVLLRQEP